MSASPEGDGSAGWGQGLYLVAVLREAFKVAFIDLFLAMLGPHCCRAFLCFWPVGAALSLWRAGLSHLSDFFPCGAEVLGTWASVPAVQGSGAQAQ